MQDPDEALELLRKRVRAGDLAGAKELVIPGLHGQRGALSIALAERRHEDAVANATMLADAGWWDPEVAATIAAHGGHEHPLVPRATSIVSSVTVARTQPVEEVAELVRAALAGGATLEAFLAAEEAIRRFAEHVELWGVVALTRNEIGDSEGARQAVRRARTLDSGNPFVELVEAQLALTHDTATHAARVREVLAAGVDAELADDVARLVETAGVWGAVLDASRRSG